MKAGPKRGTQQGTSLKAGDHKDTAAVYFGPRRYAARSPRRLFVTDQRPMSPSGEPDSKRSHSLFRSSLI